MQKLPTSFGIYSPLPTLSIHPLGSAASKNYTNTNYEAREPKNHTCHQKPPLFVGDRDLLQPIGHDPLFQSSNNHPTHQSEGFFDGGAICCFAQYNFYWIMMNYAFTLN
ncbi:MAG: hypothetical protein PHR16_16625 [Methylovulum sp.]|nr:hypothetical protein [Methylovulum sp.]